MKFAQLLNDKELTAGASVRTSFSADNIQGLIIKKDVGTSWADYYLNVNVGSTFNVARCRFDHLLSITSFNTGSSIISTGSIAMYVDLGSVWLGTNEEMEIYIDNEGSNTGYLDVIACYNSDEPNEVTTYQNIVDSNFSRENVSQIWAFAGIACAVPNDAGDLGECEDVITLQNDLGSQSTKTKVFNSYTNTQSNNEGWRYDEAMVYSDPDDLLMKVTLSTTAMYDASTNNKGVGNWIIIADDTTEDKQAKLNTRFVQKKKAKFAALPALTQRLNKLKGKI